jgi:hypothetical protein
VSGKERDRNQQAFVRFKSLVLDRRYCATSTSPDGSEIYPPTLQRMCEITLPISHGQYSSSEKLVNALTAIAQVGN